MLFLFLAFMWIIIIYSAILWFFRKKDAEDKKPAAEGVSEEYLISRLSIANRAILKDWIMNRIIDEGGRTELGPLRKEYMEEHGKRFDKLVRNLVCDGLLDHGIDTDSFSEYVRIEGNWKN